MVNESVSDHFDEERLVSVGNRRIVDCNAVSVRRAEGKEMYGDTRRKSSLSAREASSRHVNTSVGVCLGCMVTRGMSHTNLSHQNLELQHFKVVWASLHFGADHILLHDNWSLRPMRTCFSFGRRE